MPEHKFAVYETNQRCIAENMDLNDALLLIKALMTEYYADPDLSFTIERKFVEDGDGDGDG